MAKRSDGRFQTTLTVNKKRLYFYGKTKKEAQLKKDEYIESKLNKSYINEKTTLKEYMDVWIENHKLTISENTYQNYKQLVNTHINTSLGSIPLLRLTATDIRKMQREKLKNKLSNRTVAYILTILKTALNHALMDGLIPTNPMFQIKKPKIIKKEIISLTKEQANNLLENIENQNLYTITYLALHTGMRRSEILGLRTQDIDVDKNTLTINQTVLQVRQKAIVSQTTKNKSSNRSILVTDENMQVIRKHIKYFLEKKIQTKNFSANNLIFCNDIGNPINPDYVTKTIKKISTKLGFHKRFSFHCLRHTHATLLLKAGVHHKLVQNRLGHSTFQQTMDTYSHITPDLDDMLIKKLEQL